MAKSVNYVRSLFGTPVPYESKPLEKTFLLGVVSDSSGNSVVTQHCVETEMSKIVALDYVETTLSNLIAKGVNPHSLDLVDCSKLGVDAGVSDLAQYLVDHSSDYVQLISDLDKSVSKVDPSKVEPSK